MTTGTPTTPDEVDLGAFEFDRSGPRASMSTIGTVLWISGLLVVFATGYAADRGGAVDTALLARAELGQPTPLDIAERGDHLIWIERTPRAPLPDFMGGRTGPTSAAERSAEITLVDPAGNPTQLRPASGREYRASRGGTTIEGLSLARFEAEPGRYVITVSTPSAGVIGATIGPEADASNLRTAAVFAAIAAASGVALSLAARRRRRRADLLISTGRMNR